MHGDADIVCKYPFALARATLCLAGNLHIGYLRKTNGTDQVFKALDMIGVVGKNLVKKQVAICKSSGMNRGQERTPSLKQYSEHISSGKYVTAEIITGTRNQFFIAINNVKMQVGILAKTINKGILLTFMRKKRHEEVPLRHFFDQHQHRLPIGIAKSDNTQVLKIFLGKQNRMQQQQHRCA